MDIVARARACLGPLAIALGALASGCGGSSADTGSHGSCSDGARNNGETDVDCGGATCDRCAEDQTCAVDADCSTSSCLAGKCAEPVPPTCDDGKKNGGETDVDCGNECNPCGDGKSCNQSGDCASGACTSSVCAPTAKATCSDGKKNGAETDVDCGGPTCGRCGYDDACLGASDCLDDVCTDMVCAAPVCDDAIENGDETDVDCGGLDCSACASGKHCAGPMDCASQMCAAGICG